MQKIGVVLTTINKKNKNIICLEKNLKNKKWSFVVIGDKKTPNNFSLNYGNFYNLKNQKKLHLNFAKISPFNNYSRKNIGYQILFKLGCNTIIETDDDNYPKKNFFLKPQKKNYVFELEGKNWTNIYNNFIHKNTKKDYVWPRGLPLEFISDISKIKKKKVYRNFFLHQGVCEKNPDVDAIYRFGKKDINIKFKDRTKISLGNRLSPTNSQNTVWFKEIFPLMYLPVTCSMRATDIYRGLIAMRILKNDKKRILFFGTTMSQDRNEHNIYNDFQLELEMYIKNKKIYDILENLNLLKGEKYYTSNLIKCYSVLVHNKIFDQKEIIYLKAWISDLKKIFKI